MVLLVARMVAVAAGAAGGMAGGGVALPKMLRKCENMMILFAGREGRTQIFPEKKREENFLPVFSLGFFDSSTTLCYSTDAQLIVLY